LSIELSQGSAALVVVEEREEVTGNEAALGGKPHRQIVEGRNLVGRWG